MFCSLLIKLRIWKELVIIILQKARAKLVYIFRKLPLFFNKVRLLIVIEVPVIIQFENWYHLKITVFRDVAPFSLVEFYRRFICLLPPSSASFRNVVCF
jgi:hypothetical protein